MRIAHTHNAPMTTPSMPRLGVANPDYIDYVAAQITALVKSIEEQGTPLICTYHEGMLDHTMNRRLICCRLTRSGFTRSAGFGPNPAGSRDESVRVLKFALPSGEPVAVLWNYACHASGFYDRLQVSAAYPGIVRLRLRAELGDIPVLFFQGFSGDLRPPFVGISGGGG